MRAEKRITRAVALGPLQQMSLGASETVAPVDSFEVTLSQCAAVSREQRTPAETVAFEAPPTAQPVKDSARTDAWLDVVKRAWSFVREKYTVSTAKRMRVSETISLGEKRFVAIVTVEGREFLIGGGAAGMSLLAQLGGLPGVPRDLRQALRDAGGAL